MPTINTDLLTKILDIVGSCFMIALGIAELTEVYAMSPINYIVSCYLIIMGIFFILVEIPIQIIAAQFNFLKDIFGKALFCLYLGLLCFHQSFWYTITVAVVWWVIALLYLILGIIGVSGGKGGSSGGTQVVSSTTRTGK